MLKGDVFEYQEFENQIFALFIHLFMNKASGVARSYKNSMNITYSGHTVTIDSGACLIQGRLLEEDSSTTIDTGIETAFCKLVVEIDLDKTNTEEEFNQGVYKIVKDVSNFPSLTQQDTAGTNQGKYQYELARFKVSSGVVAEFEDKRTFIEDQLQYGGIDYLNNQVSNLSTTVQNNSNSLRTKLEKTQIITTANTNLDNYTTDGVYYFGSDYTPTNIPAGVNGWLQVFQDKDKVAVKQIWYRFGTPGTNDFETYVRTKSSVSWGAWVKYGTHDKDNSATLNFTQTGTAYIVRRGNSVTMQIYALPSDNRDYSSATNYINLPDWAKPSSAFGYNPEFSVANKNGASAMLTVASSRAILPIQNGGHTDTEFSFCVTYVAD